MKRLLSLLIPILCLAGGILFLYMGIQDVQNRAVFLDATGVITDIQVRYHAAEENDYSVFVKYTVDGKEYESELGEYTASMREGQDVAILYDPMNPDRIMSASFLAPVLLFSMSGICLFGFVVLVIQWINRRND